MPCVQKLAFALVALTCVAPFTLSAQILATPPPVSALKLPLSVTLSGTAKWTAGSTQDFGNVTLKVNADGSTSENWGLRSGQQSSAQTSFSAGRNCQQTDKNGSRELHSAGCFRPVPWFAPWQADQTLLDKLTSTIEDTTDADKAAGYKKLSFRLALALPKDPKSPAIKGLNALMTDSAVQVTYDMVTNLPVRLDFHDVPESDSLKTIETYVKFSDYREENGFPIPHHIQRYVQRALQADVQINSVTIQ